MSDIHAHLLPHTRSASVATALFTRAEIDDAVTTAAGLEPVLDTVSKKGGWAKAATEAASTADPERMRALARYPQKGVVRALAGNPSLPADVIASVVSWAQANESDADALKSLVGSTDLPRLSEALGDDRASSLVRTYSSTAVDRAVTHGPPADVVTLLQGDHGNRAARQVVDRYELAASGYGHDSTTVVDLDEAFDAAVFACAIRAEVLTKALQRTNFSPGLARLLAAHASDDELSRATGAMVRNHEHVSEADWFVAQRPTAHAVRFAGACTLQLASATYDVCLDVVESHGEETGTALRVVEDLQTNHVGFLDGRQLDRHARQVMVRATTTGTEKPPAQLHEFALNLVVLHGHRLDRDLVLQLAATTPVDAIDALTGGRTTSGYGYAKGKVYQHDTCTADLDGELLAALVGDRPAPMSHYDSWLARSIDTFTSGPFDIPLADVLDAMSVQVQQRTVEPPVAAALAQLFDDRFGDDIEAWDTAVTFITDGWEGPLSDLAELVCATLGIVPDVAPAQPDPEPALEADVTEDEAPAEADVADEQTRDVVQVPCLADAGPMAQPSLFDAA